MLAYNKEPSQLKMTQPSYETLQQVLEKCANSKGSHFDVAVLVQTVLREAMPAPPPRPIIDNPSASEESDEDFRADVAKTRFVYCDKDWYEFVSENHKWFKDCEASSLRRFISTDVVVIVNIEARKRKALADAVPDDNQLLKTQCGDYAKSLQSIAANLKNSGYKKEKVIP